MSAQFALLAIQFKEANGQTVKMSKVITSGKGAGDVLRH